MEGRLGVDLQVQVIPKGGTGAERSESGRLVYDDNLVCGIWYYDVTRCVCGNPCGYTVKIVRLTAVGFDTFYDSNHQYWYQLIWRSYRSSTLLRVDVKRFSRDF